MRNTMDNRNDNALYGFWIYLMTDLIMFAALFATFAVLRNNTFGGVAGKDIFDMPYVFTETIILLTSSLTCGLAMISIQKSQFRQTFLYFGATFLLGASFLTMELLEFSHLIAAGHGPQASAFLSSYFTLVGTHGLHIAVGLLWMLISLIMVWIKGLNKNTGNKLTRLALFWHFLDIVWIFIFTIVYLLAL